jgi:hypothetical protein
MFAVTEFKRKGKLLPILLPLRLILTITGPIRTTRNQPKTLGTGLLHRSENIPHVIDFTRFADFDPDVLDYQ